MMAILMDHRLQIAWLQWKSCVRYERRREIHSKHLSEGVSRKLKKKMWGKWRNALKTATSKLKKLKRYSLLHLLFSNNNYMVYVGYCG